MNRNPATPNTKQPPQSPPQSAATPRKPTPGKQQNPKPSSAGTEPVEGEGSYSATHRYNEGLREHIAHHDVESEGEAARKALEGDERRELEEAEERGKAPAKR